MRYLLLFSLLLSACQNLPTRIYQRDTSPIGPLVEGAKTALLIDKDTKVIDARVPFDFAVAHLPGAINLQWQEFAQARGPFMGLIEKDEFKLARRLARFGITPESKVVVVGKGLSGDGEEGRIAWTLFYLGVSDVHFADIGYFKSRLTNIESPPVENAPIWKPIARASVLAEREEVIKAVATAEGANQKTHIIDVRSEKEYFEKKNARSYSLPDLKAVNIEWKQFFNRDGRPNLSIKAQLTGIGIAPTDRVIVLSNQGVRSAAVTMALLAMGYSRAANYAGGLKELMTTRR